MKSGCQVGFEGFRLIAPPRAPLTPPWRRRAEGTVAAASDGIRTWLAQRSPKIQPKRANGPKPSAMPNLASRFLLMTFAHHAVPGHAARTPASLHMRINSKPTSPFQIIATVIAQVGALMTRGYKCEFHGADERHTARSTRVSARV